MIPDLCKIEEIAATRKETETYLYEILALEKSISG